MIICSDCQYPNLLGAVYCSECGTALVVSGAPITQDMRAVASGATAHMTPPASEPVLRTDNWITLHILDTGEMLPLEEHNEFTLGRTSDGQPVMPDIDLSPYDAYGKGVSRLHAVLRRGISDVVLVDLDSANGTFINGKRLTANEEWALANGDVVALGRLKFQVLLKDPHTKGMT